MRNGFLCSMLASVLFSALFMVGVGAHSIELEYVSPDKKAELEKDFAAAQFSSKHIAKIKQNEWTCDMYGVRTRLQVKRGVKLYKWSNESDWHNRGAQIVREYHADDNQLSGSHGQLEDQVKVNSRGQLISRLSITRPEHQVVAYAVCDTP